MSENEYKEVKIEVLEFECEDVVTESPCPTYDANCSQNEN